MKKFVSYLLSTCMIMTVVSGCSQKEEPSPTVETSEESTTQPTPEDVIQEDILETDEDTSVLVEEEEAPVEDPEEEETPEEAPPMEEMSNPEESTGYFEIVDGLLAKFEGKQGHVVIPENVHTIGEGAFYGLAYTQKITIPDSVTTIDVRAFEACTALATIVIPETVTSCDPQAFKDCPSLEVSVSSEAPFLEALKDAGISVVEYSP